MRKGSITRQTHGAAGTSAAGSANGGESEISSRSRHQVHAVKGGASEGRGAKGGGGHFPERRGARRRAHEGGGRPPAGLTGDPARPSGSPDGGHRADRARHGICSRVCAPRCLLGNACHAGAGRGGRPRGVRLRSRAGCPRPRAGRHGMTVRYDGANHCTVLYCTAPYGLRAGRAPVLAGTVPSPPGGHGGARAREGGPWAR